MPQRHGNNSVANNVCAVRNETETICLKGKDKGFLHLIVTWEENGFFTVDQTSENIPAIRLRRHLHRIFTVPFTETMNLSLSEAINVFALSIERQTSVIQNKR